MDIARLPVPVSARRPYPQRVNRSADPGRSAPSNSHALQPRPSPTAGQAVQGELLLNQRFYGRRAGTFQAGTYSAVATSVPRTASAMQAQRVVGAYLDNARLGTTGAQTQGRSVDYFV
ncbi:MAG TPA: hypothetical protein VKA76_14235 [Gammaproteobacteria bacterium]|nr:hypothetical protein [Gammaproteobacteria bacterium]